HNVPGEALFISAGRKALRLEVPEIGKEFTDGAYIGKDPEGILFYNNADSFDATRSVKYQCSRYINQFDNKVCCLVKFYTKDPKHCHAEFLAYDPEETVRSCAMDGYESSGNWKDLVLGSSTASIRKWDDDDTLEISIGPLRKKAIIRDSKGVLDGQSVAVQGNIHFKDINTISNGLFASYNDDRIVFYQSSFNSTDFTAFFVPFESSPNKLGIASSRTTEFSGITWSNT
ncbi:hypothetical protein FRC01_005687, partial [Tulasnella sp. 417]